MQVLKRSFLTALTFGVVGPLFGVLAVAVFAYEVLGSAGDSPGRWLGALYMIPFGYIFGFVPAALAGAAAGALLTPTRWIAFLPAAAVIGGLSAGLMGFLDAEPMTVDEGVVNLAIIGAVSGLLSGGVSIILSRRRNSGAVPSA
jgi:hypothetical protein